MFLGVTHQCASRYHIDASTHTLSAADRSVRLKHNRYDDLAHREGGTFIVLVCETYGAMSHEFDSFIQEIIQSTSRIHTMTTQQATSLLHDAYLTIAFCHVTSPQAGCCPTPS